MEENKLRELFAMTKADTSRAELASDRATTSALTSQLRESFKAFLCEPCHFEGYSAMLVLVRTLRNLCVKQPEMQEWFWDGGVLTSVTEMCVSSLRKTESDAEPRLMEASKVLLQFIGNAVTCNAKVQEAMWPSFVPMVLRLCLKAGNNAVAGTAMMVTHNCMSSSAKRRGDFLSGIRDGGSEHVLMDILKRIAAPGDSKDEGTPGPEDAEWAFILVEGLLREEGVEECWDALKMPDQAVSEGQVALLRVVDGIGYKGLSVHESQGALPSSLNVNDVAFIGRLLRGLVVVDNGTGIAATPEDQAMSDSCWILVQTLANLTSKRSTDVQMALLKEEVVFALVALLRVVDHGAEALITLRRETLRTLGNLCHRCRPVQDEMRNIGGIEAVMNNTSIDGHNDYMREWAVVAIRNLCEGNDENQTYISRIELKDVADNPDLRRMGFKAELNEEKKVVLKKLDEGPSA